MLGEGDLPDFVQVWDPPCEKADFLLLPTHADDEHLWFGGTMPYYAGELGYKIQVVYLMKHVYGRHHELINGLWTVGVRNYPVISEFIDKYCANLAQAQRYYPEEEVLEFLVENIRRFKPEVIVGHDLEGEYGHGAHILNAKVLSEQALSAANDPALFNESLDRYGPWETKKCYLHLYQENEIFINWKEKVLTAFDGVNAYDMAQKGFDQHVSQRAFFSMSLDNRARYGNGLFGLYSTTVGEDVLKNDFLENIPPQCLTTWVEPEPEPESTDSIADSESLTTDTYMQTTDPSFTQNHPVALAGICFLVILCVAVGLIVILMAPAPRRGRRHSTM
ncbi:MAG: PIG-L family deacetylase [Clostridia bacterium]|nr:PIG-L family deacetylase [Clostridia bacterium]